MTLKILSDKMVELLAELNEKTKTKLRLASDTLIKRDKHPTDM
jgi:hypothetical protein